MTTLGLHMKIDLCSTCHTRLCHQLASENDIFAKTNELDLRKLLFSKLCLTKALLLSHDLNQPPGLALYQYLSTLFSTSDLKPTGQNAQFPDSNQIRHIFADRIESDRWITYHLPTGWYVMTYQKFRGDEILLPILPTKENVPAIPGLFSRRQLHPSRVVQVDTFEQLTDAATLAHQTILLIVDYLDQLMAFDPVFEQIANLDGHLPQRKLCPVCRQKLRQYYYRQKKVYEHDCPAYSRHLILVDIITTAYFNRSASLSLRHLDSLAVVVEKLAALQLCRRCIEQGVIPGDENCRLYQ